MHQAETINQHRSGRKHFTVTHHRAACCKAHYLNLQDFSQNTPDPLRLCQSCVTPSSCCHLKSHPLVIPLPSMAVAVAAALRGPHRQSGPEKSDRGNGGAIMTLPFLAGGCDESSACGSEGVHRVLASEFVGRCRSSEVSRRRSVRALNL